MDQRDVERLRQHGFSDEQITVAAQVIGYFNYITRIAQGLGVEHESWMDVPYEQWRRERGVTTWRVSLRDGDERRPTRKPRRLTSDCEEDTEQRLCRRSAVEN